MIDSLRVELTRIKEPADAAVSSPEITVRGATMNDDRILRARFRSAGVLLFGSFLLTGSMTSTGCVVSLFPYIRQDGAYGRAVRPAGFAVYCPSWYARCPLPSRSPVERKKSIDDVGA